MLLKIGGQEQLLRVVLQNTARATAVVSVQATTVAKVLPFTGAIVSVFGTVSSFTVSLLALKAVGLRGDSLDKALDGHAAELSRIYSTITILSNRIKSQEETIRILNTSLDSFNSDLISLGNKYQNLNNIAAQANSNASKALADIDRTIKPKLISLNNDTAEAKSNASQAIIRINNINLEPKIKDLNDDTAEAKSNAS
ncbi:hypothetical protein, partial [Limnofasciculus baicalensis]